MSKTTNLSYEVNVVSRFSIPNYFLGKDYQGAIVYTMEKFGIRFRHQLKIEIKLIYFSCYNLEIKFE